MTREEGESMKRKPSSPQQIYQTERDRVRRRKDAAFATVMDEARRAFEQEIEASRAKGRGGRPRKVREKAG
jgi:hypothetical protein